MEKWLVYILKCSDGSFYTGITNDIGKRFNRHKNGDGGRYTRSHKPIEIVFTEDAKDRGAALKRESQIKGWTRHKKIKLIKNKNLSG